MPQLLADEQRFYVYFRMTKNSFDEILGMIETYISKEHTNYRGPIAPEERLAVTLRNNMCHSYFQVSCNWRHVQDYWSKLKSWVHNC
ncbi:hypothetical protein PR048_028149 [Dryococelus australis]|uniref:Uncharacterized protein n=1 Tax=Dryococelus australis TaxID=614101 RepID=A0ABQ9GIH9_9NEOP|nr:hypothetical protein PR048_028149 [Dryococelus australis]